LAQVIGSTRASYVIVGGAWDDVVSRPSMIIPCRWPITLRHVEGRYHTATNTATERA